MMDRDEIQLRVCKKCDAPLPCDIEHLNYFTKDYFICDDCHENL